MFSFVSCTFNMAVTIIMEMTRNNKFLVNQALQWIQLASPIIFIDSFKRFCFSCTNSCKEENKPFESAVPVFISSRQRRQLNLFHTATKGPDPSVPTIECLYYRDRVVWILVSLGPRELFIIDRCLWGECHTLEFTLHCIGSQGVSMIVVSHMSLKRRQSKVIHSLGKCIVLLVFHRNWAWHAFFFVILQLRIYIFFMQDRIFSQYSLNLRLLVLEVLEVDLMSNWPLKPHHPQLPFSFV